MDRLHIDGPCRLAGTIDASGAKNAALPILAACLLAEAPVTLHNLPRVRDIRTMDKLLNHLGVASTLGDDGGLILTPDGNGNPDDAPYELVKTMRASVLVLGPLVARRGRARVSLPGGCAIGVRPIDQHLRGLEALGATVTLEHGYVEVRADRLTGAPFRFAVPTVTGTENVLMAAACAQGTTVLENCAREPEIVDLATFLRTLGARIEGDGTSTITVEGVERLGGGSHRVIADRIEIGTYLIGAAMTRGDVTVRGARPADLAPLLEKLADIGAVVEVLDDAGDRRDAVTHSRIGGQPHASIRVVATDAALHARDIITAPHPGFPTDLQAQYLALMTRAQGRATVCETVFENRFQHVPELQRMGAQIRVEGRLAHVDGPAALSGAQVMATDLRASACLVLAGLVAEGRTVVDRIYHLDRGYQEMERKLQKLGASVRRVTDRDPEHSPPSSSPAPDAT
ncbi:MAG: UDP-N-acetylglucosamine 1-carboxyvinyltransferase [Acidobacteriota bacterium]